MKKLKEMKKNNKGFSLVELIIVIAIMAVLMAVLAPQFLRYIERSRLQSDNTAIGEIANACKVAATNETAITGAPITITIPTAPAAAANVTVAGTGAAAGVTAFQNEINATIGTVRLTSNTYTAAGATAPTITVTVTGGVVQVNGTNYIPEVGATAEANHLF